MLTLVKNRAAHLARLIDGLQRSDVMPAQLVVVDMEGGWRAPAESGFAIRVIELPSAGLPLAEECRRPWAAGSTKRSTATAYPCREVWTSIARIKS